MEVLEDQIKGTGMTLSQVVVHLRTLTEARTFMAEERKTGDLDLDQDSKEGQDLGGEDTVEEAVVGTGATMRGLVEVTSEAVETIGENVFHFSSSLKICDADIMGIMGCGWTACPDKTCFVFTWFVGLERGGPVGLGPEVFLMSMAFQMKSSMVRTI